MVSSCSISILQEGAVEFEDWLLMQGLSESSIRKYAGAIDGPLTKWGTEHAILTAPIRTINDPNEFAELAELIENTDIFIDRNKRGNSMYGAALNNYAKYLNAAHSAENNAESPLGPFSNELPFIVEAVAADTAFEPEGIVDARARVLRDVVRRQGQPKFRKELVAAYQGRCAITGCPLKDALEAAHITPYLGPATNHVSNGLLLRADMHTLWDLGLIAVDPTTFTIAIGPSVHYADYQNLHGISIFQPVPMKCRPSIAALNQHWAIFHGKNLA